jgi:hypothetical protein
MTKVTLEEIINNMVSNIKADLSSDNEEKKEKAFNIVLKAYNVYQREERDGVDYIFNANDIEDCKTLVNCGMTHKKFHNVVITSETKSDYFFYGINYPEIMFLTKTQLFAQLWATLEDVVKHSMIQPYLDGYNQIFHNYVSHVLYERLIVDDEI